MIDLGSGAGFDAFLAAIKVGPTGRVIGVDMNKVSNTANDRATALVIFEVLGPDAQSDNRTCSPAPTT